MTISATTSMSQISRADWIQRFGATQGIGNHRQAPVTTAADAAIAAEVAKRNAHSGPYLYRGEGQQPIHVEYSPDMGYVASTFVDDGFQMKEILGQGSSPEEAAAEATASAARYLQGQRRSAY